MALPNALYIWNDKSGAGRNRFVLFRRTFSLLGPKAGHLHIFADTRYRLIVNGQTIGHGPGRFLLSKPEYDTHDLTAYLRTGRNVIAVIVNSCGSLTLQSESSIGGLLIWGEAQDKTGRTVRFNTDDSWRTLESPGHRCDTPYLSFALNPAEFLDARAMPAGWEQADFDDREWPFATPIRRQDHWGQPQPRSIPLLDERKILPRRRLGAWVARIDPHEQIHSLLVTTSSGRSLHTNARVALWTHIHSPKAQKIAFGVSCSHCWINGQPPSPIEQKGLSLRHEVLARLNEGWNTLLVYNSIKSDWWDFHLALPVEAELELSAERRIDSAHTFLIGGPWEDELAEEADRMPLPLAGSGDLPEKLGAWTAWPRESKADTPCRERAWKRFEKLDEQANLKVHVPGYAARIGSKTLCLLYDFGSEVLGRPVIDFEAEAGTIVDLTYSDRLKADGTADVHARPFVDMAERYIACRGRQQWQTFHPRGFRYLELLIQGDLGSFHLHEVALTRAAYPVEGIGSFECSSPTLNEIWRLGRQTLRVCMEDAYLNCPSRERALYLDDLLVQFNASVACMGDTQLFRRCIELFLLAQGDDGLIPPAAHGLSVGQRSDHSALLPQALWQYWTHTGDLAFLKSHLPRLRRLIKSLESLRVEGTDLLYGPQPEAMINRGPMGKHGLNCTLNCFYQRAFFDAARIMYLVGQPELGRSCSDRAQSLAEAIRREFWDDERGAFLNRRRSNVAQPEPSATASALAILYDIASPDQSARAVAHLIEAIHNPRCADMNANSHAIPYFAFYALGALYRQGKAVEAEEFIQRFWGSMLEQSGSPHSEPPLGDKAPSHYHSLQAAPMHYLAAQVLGITFPEPGNPRRVLIRPQPGSLAWAEGSYPHPDGPIHIRWERQGSKILLRHRAPPDVQIVTRLPQG